MYNIRYYLLVMSLLGGGVGFAHPAKLAFLQANLAANLGQRTVFYSPPAHRSEAAQKKAHVQKIDQGPEGDPALPDPLTNPNAMAAASLPGGVSLRRRKLLVRPRH